nr:MAG TPA: hypothetical protein [Caudoviricetes sp.]
MFVALSRLNQGFDSPRRYQLRKALKILYLSVFQGFFIHLPDSAYSRGVYPIRYSRRAYGIIDQCFREKFLFLRRVCEHRY